MKKEMLINVLQPEECRIAILEDNVLEELYVERTSQESYVGNIYKGRIVNIEPSIQAAFVDFGIGRNGFLHVSDVEPAYYRHLEGFGDDDYGSRRGRDRSRSRGSSPDRPRRMNRDDAREPGEGVESESPSRSDEPDDSAGRHGRRRDSGREHSRGRRGGRKRSGRPRGGRRSGAPGTAHEELASDIAALEAAEQRAEAEPATPLESQSETPPPSPDEPPLFMHSAEHRTTDNGGSANQGQEPKDEDDADVFFPRPHRESSAPVHESVLPTQPDNADTDLEVHAADDAWGGDSEEMPEEPQADSRAGESDVLVPEEFDEAPMAAETVSEADAAQEPAEHDEGDELLSDLEPPEEPAFRRRRSGGGRDERRGGRQNRRFPGRSSMTRPKPLIQDIFRRGQEVLVQVIKEGIGTKGPTLSTYISIAGRYLVLMPGLNRVGVSRKIADDDQRRRLRDIFHELKPPRGLGFIIRTAGIDRTQIELQRDLAYLARLWQVVVRRIRNLKAPTEIYQESDMITRTIRDIFTTDIDSIWVDEPKAYEHAKEFLQIVMPRYAERIKHYTGSEPLFHHYGIEEEIARIQQRHVPLPNGGSIVIDQTEALVAVDVNSGNFRADNNAEETAFRINLHAAREIARQLRLRDLGGVIVNDFIDMREERHRRDVEHALREAVRRDRARTKILKISQFGIIEMTRQRIRPSLKRSVYQDCPHCKGTAQVKTTESMSIDVMRMIQLAAHRANVKHIDIRVHEDVANYLSNRKRREISRLEEEGSLQVAIRGVMGASPELMEIVCYDSSNSEVKFLPYEEPRKRR